MVWAAPVWIPRQRLLVIGGADAICATQIAQLYDAGHAAARPSWEISALLTRLANSSDLSTACSRAPIRCVSGVGYLYSCRERRSGVPSPAYSIVSPDDPGPRGCSADRRQSRPLLVSPKSSMPRQTGKLQQGCVAPHQGIVRCGTSPRPSPAIPRRHGAPTRACARAGARLPAGDIPGNRPSVACARNFSAPGLSTNGSSSRSTRIRRVPTLPCSSSNPTQITRGDRSSGKMLMPFARTRKSWDCAHASASAFFTPATEPTGILPSRLLKKAD